MTEIKEDKQLLTELESLKSIVEKESEAITEENKEKWNMVVEHPYCYLPEKIDGTALYLEIEEIENRINTIKILEDNKYKGEIPSASNIPNTNTNMSFDANMSSDVNMDSEIMLIVDFPLLRILYFCLLYRFIIKAYLRS